MNLQRHEEIMDKCIKLKEEMLGEKAEDMMYLNLIATSPACQGQGYGKALLKSITDTVSWLIDTRRRRYLTVTQRLTRVGELCIFFPATLIIRRSIIISDL